MLQIVEALVVVVLTFLFVGWLLMLALGALALSTGFAAISLSYGETLLLYFVSNILFGSTAVVSGQRKA